MHPSTPIPQSPHAADLDTLYRAYRTHVLTQARAATGDATLAQDIASEVWAYLAAHPRPLSDPEHLHAYLAVLVRHAAADHYRCASAHETPTADDAPAWHCATAPAAEEAVLAEPATEPGLPARWRDAMATALTGRQRAALLLHCEGFSQRAIAAREGYAPATASFHVRRAVVYLRAALAVSGMEVAA
ncbi:RNA polymerase sigma factor [Streptomyces sp. NPDC001380]|uniref:RNA polymerase sigma factor n=1 Tax=Streptomyces sp. NPDC001380 TaxID=3364566 RepID=UPI00368789CB